MQNNNLKTSSKQVMLWIGALILGAILGLLQQEWINSSADFLATAYTRLFQLLAVPTMALGVITTHATLGTQKDRGRIFRHAIYYPKFIITTIQTGESSVK